MPSGLVRQTSATLVAAALQHNAAGTSRHALQEAMLFRALAFFGLKGPFWHYYLTFFTFVY